MSRIAVLTVLLVTGVVTGQPPKPAAPSADLAAVPRDGFAVVSLKASAAWDLPALKPLRDWAAAQTDLPVPATVGVGLADLDRVTLYWPAADLRFGVDRPLVLVTTRKPYNEARVVKNVARPDNRPGVARYGSVLFAGNRRLTLVDETTLALDIGQDRDDGAARSAVLVGQLLARRTEGPLAAALAAAGDHPLVAGLDMAALGRGPLAELGVGFPGYAALFKATTATLVADVADGGAATVTLTLQFPDAAAARRAGPVVEEGAAELARLAGEAAGAEVGPRDEAAKVVYGWLAGGLKGAKVEVKGPAVVATASAPLEPMVGQLAAKLPASLARAQDEITAQNNLKQILLGLHNSHDAFGVFAGDVGPDGKRPWSWRVQLLPFLEEENLSKRLDFTLPWDDPKNKAVLEAAAMPKLFEVPGRPAPKGHTYWRSFSSPKGGGGHAWLTRGERGPRVATVTDGLSNTFAVVEAGESVPWYAPDTLTYDPAKPLPPLGAKDAKTFLAGMGDGSVRAVPRGTREEVLRAMITRDGGEVVSLEDDDRPRSPAAKSESSPPPPPK